MSIPTTLLGSGGPVVGLQGLGCMGMSEFYGDTVEDTARETLAAALDAGVTLFDTAAMYGQGENERFLAPFVKANRDRVIIATKFGVVRNDDGTMVTDNTPEFIRREVEGSLSRLGVDVIDVYYMHRRDPKVPLAVSVGAMAELVQQGKVRYLGLSEVTGDELREAHEVHPIAAVESEWSLFTRDIERSLVAAAADLNVAVVPYSPLGRGILTGALPTTFAEGDFRAALPRFTGENARHNAALLEPVLTIAGDRGITPAQVALGWVHQQASVHGLGVVPIPGTRNPDRLHENLAAADVVLTERELAQLEPLADRVQGDRYPDMTDTAATRETR
jgi:aryl-alcohol dehydrogenase-like predicted oxidoreductase